MIYKTFTELSKLESFEARYEYLKLGSNVGEMTFGFDRYLNQLLYKSKIWAKVRDSVILRDEGWDLGLKGFLEIGGRVVVHHMNPITSEQIEYKDKDILDPEFLVCCSNSTHQAIHYGNISILPQKMIERTSNDTSPWMKKG